MDARELTKAFYELQNKVLDLQKEVDFLNQEAQKQRLLIDDMKYGIKDLEQRWSNEHRRYH